jgi:hypothetical protein
VGAAFALEVGGDPMKKLRALLAILLGTAVVVTAAPAASSGTTLPVTFFCSQSPKECVGHGVLGPLSALYESTPTETVGVVCVRNFLGACGLAHAILVIEPGLVGVGGDSRFLNTGVGGTVLANRTLTLAVINTDLFGRSYTVLVGAGGGVAGVVVLAPHVRKCLLMQGTTITAPNC